MGHVCPRELCGRGHGFPVLCLFPLLGPSSKKSPSSHPGPAPTPGVQEGPLRVSRALCNPCLCLCMFREGGPTHHLQVRKGSLGCLVPREATDSSLSPSCPSFGRLQGLELSSVSGATCDVRGTQSCAAKTLPPAGHLASSLLGGPCPDLHPPLGL